MYQLIVDHSLFGGLLLNIYTTEPQQAAQACIIWMHGLGADAQDMAGLAEQVNTNAPIRHVFLDAPVRVVTINNFTPMRAWYDITGNQLTNRQDKPGILESADLIKQIIDDQLSKGMTYQQLFLAGFSQGGAMALFTGLNIKARLGGIIALSSYLPLESECKAILDNKTPFFIAGGTYDGVVLPEWTKHSVDWVKSHGYENVTYHDYPMEHSICLNEIRDLTRWLDAQMSSITQD